MRRLFLLSLLFILGLGLRFLYFQSLRFDFDQVQILTNARLISQGKLTLIGPRTGPAGMFTGPLIYYLAALAYLIVSNPWSLVVLSLLIYVINFGGIAYLCRQYLPSPTGWLFLAFWCLSPFMVNSDRIVWNPNLMFLAAALVCLPLSHWWVTLKLKPIDPLMIALGCFLGYQAHFAGFLLWPLVLLAVLAHASLRTPGVKLIVAGILGTGLSLFPTLLFDLRHQWLNTRGLGQFIFGLNSSSGPSLPWYRNLWPITLITIENLGKNLWPNQGSPVIYVLGFLILVGYLIVNLKSHSPFRRYGLPLLWTGAVMLIFCFYPGAKPEYYFLIQFPAILLMTVDFIGRLPYWVISGILLGLFLSLMVNNYRDFYLHPHLTLAEQIKTADYLDQLNHLEGVGRVNLDLEYQDLNGLTYLLKDFPYRPQGSVYHVIYRPSMVPEGTYVSGPTLAVQKEP